MAPSAPDVAIALTLSLGGRRKDSLPPAMWAYVNLIAGPASPSYMAAISLAESLVLDPADPSLLNASSAIFASAITSAFPDADLGRIDIRAFRCKDVKHSDYQCNFAMPLYQKLKVSGLLPPGLNSPQQLAQRVIQEVGGWGRLAIPYCAT